MSLPRLAIVDHPLSLEPLAAAIEAEARHDGEGCGAICTFLGIVRATHAGRRVHWLDYEAYEPLALRSFERIAAEAAAEWPSVRLAIHHRTGRLAVGEASVAIVAAAAHRQDAFRACRYAIERIKQVAPIWKREWFDDGDSWVEGAVADPADAEARDRARAAACA